jgi:predicted aminopeptidase
LAVLISLFASFTLLGCQLNYLVRSAVSQAELLRRRVPIEEALKDPRLTAEQKRKMLLARDAKTFAENNLGLAKTKNYSAYVQLDRP